MPGKKRFSFKSTLLRLRLRFRGHKKPNINLNLSSPTLVLAARPTRLSKKVLFVCTTGSTTSPLAVCGFASLANKKPVSANLAIAHSGHKLHSPQKFKGIVSSFDFVAPMGSEVRAAVDRALKDVKQKPVVIGHEWSGLGRDLFRRETYRPVLKAIRDALKEEKRKKKEKKG